jgi:hypothetical protein
MKTIVTIIVITDVGVHGIYIRIITVTSSHTEAELHNVRYC